MGDPWTSLNPKYRYAKPRKNVDLGIFYSDYFLTLSSNVSVKKKSIMEINQIHAALEEVLRCSFQGRHLEQIFYVVEGDVKHNPKRIGSPMASDFIEPPEIEVAFETGKKGSKGNRAHLHALVHTKHHKKFQMDVQALRKILEFCKRQYNEDAGSGFQFAHKIYLNVKYVPSKEGLEDYLSKQAQDFGIHSVPLRPIEFWKTYAGKSNNYEYPV